MAQTHVLNPLTLTLWQNNPFYEEIEIDEDSFASLPAECSDEDGAPLLDSITEDIATEPAHVPTSHIGDATYDGNETAVRHSVHLLPSQQTPTTIQDLVERLGDFVTINVTTRTAVRTFTFTARTSVTQPSHGL